MSSSFGIPGLISHNIAVLADSRLSEKNITNIPEEEIYHDHGSNPIRLSEVTNGRLWEEATEDPECKEKMYPVLEGPALYLLMLSEMLLQSHNGILRLFPALPDEKDATFLDFRGEGAVLVSSARLNGIVRFVRIKALEKNTVRLLNPWLNDGYIYSSIDGEIKSDKFLELNLSQNDEIIMASSKEDLDYPVMSGLSESDAQARKIEFEDGMIAWLGKPVQSEYYVALEKARSGE